MTYIEKAKKNQDDKVLSYISYREGMDLKKLRNGLKKGTIVVPKNKNREIKKPCGIGRGLTTKVNVNIGTSPDSFNIQKEIQKLELSVRLGADAIMDLSVGPDLNRIRSEVLKNCPIPIGTVPVYEAAMMADDIKSIKEKDIIDVVLKQAKEGIDFFTIHAGVTRETIKVLKKAKRTIDIVSRGGAILARWMQENNKENPFYARFDEILDIAKEYDITLSLGDGMKPGSILDATDGPQIHELKVLGQLQKRALSKNVQSMIEGPGHVPLDQIKKNMQLEKKYCNGAPFYVLGPLVTDVGCGYDHITSAIGGAFAAWHGADFLCYVTPSEHLALPDIEDVRNGLIASKIAAHAADIAKGNKRAIERDRAMSKARRNRDWRTQFSLSFDQFKAEEYRKRSKPKNEDVCTMCSRYCPIKITEGKE